MQNTPRGRQSIFPLLWIMVFDHTSLTLTFPVLTLLFFDTQTRLFPPDTSLAVRSQWYGLCVAVPHIMNIVIAPLLSALSDEFGRKKILVMGTAGAFLFAIITGLGVLWGMLELLLFGLVIQGIFSRTNPVAMAVIGELSPREIKIRNMGYLQTSISIGAFIGPIVGGYCAQQFFFQELNFSLPYFVAAVFAGISCLLTIIIFRETLQEKTARRSWLRINVGGFKKVLQNTLVLRIALILLLCQISWSIYYQFVPPTLKLVLGFGAHRLGLFVGMIACWLALATTFGIRWLEKFFNARQCVFLGLSLVLAGLLCSALFFLLPVHLTHWLIWLPAIPIAAGDVLVYSCLTAHFSNAVALGDQGKVMGFAYVVTAVIWSLTGLLGGWLMSFDTLLPLFCAPVGVLLGIMVLRRDVGLLT